MKKLLLVLIIICPIMSFSQQHYRFDMVLKYKYIQHFDNEKSFDRVYLINSKDNSYYAILTDKNKNNFNLNLFQQDYLHAASVIKKSDLTKENIVVDCNDVSHYSNPYKYQTDNYSFTPVRDTILNGVPHIFFWLKNISTGRETRMKFGRNLYISDNRIDCKPIFTFSTAYEEWKVNGKIPDGLLKESHTFNSDGTPSTSEILVSSEVVTKQIIIPKCQ